MEHAGHPYPYVASPRQYFREDLFLQCLEGIRLTKEIGHTDEEFLEKGLDFQGIVLKKAQVILLPCKLVHGHTSFDASDNGVFLIVREIVMRP